MQLNRNKIEGEVDILDRGWNHENLGAGISGFGVWMEWELNLECFGFEFDKIGKGEGCLAFSGFGTRSDLCVSVRYWRFTPLHRNQRRIEPLLWSLVLWCEDVLCNFEVEWKNEILWWFLWLWCCYCVLLSSDLEFNLSEYEYYSLFGI